MTADEVLALLRKHVAKHKTQGEAAKSLGVSGAYLSDVLNSRRDPGPTILKALGLQKSYERVR